MLGGKKIERSVVIIPTNGLAGKDEQIILAIENPDEGFELPNVDLTDDMTFDDGIDMIVRDLLNIEQFVLDGEKPVALRTIDSNDGKKKVTVYLVAVRINEVAFEAQDDDCYPYDYNPDIYEGAGPFNLSQILNPEPGMEIKEPISKSTIAMLKYYDNQKKALFKEAFETILDSASSPEDEQKIAEEVEAGIQASQGAVPPQEAEEPEEITGVQVPETKVVDMNKLDGTEFDGVNTLVIQNADKLVLLFEKVSGLTVRFESGAKMTGKIVSSGKKDGESK